MRELQLARERSATQGKKLEYFTIGWNLAEGVVAGAAGAASGSLSLIAFGLDSLIEVASGAALLRRLSVDPDEHARERHERVALRIVGVCFLLLAAYIAVDSIHSLIVSHSPGHSIWGIAIAVASLVVMPLLARAKRKIASELESGAMRADARQTDFCAYLSAILVVGLALNWLLGWWWTDSVAGLLMVPIIALEGVHALHHRTCAC